MSRSIRNAIFVSVLISRCATDRVSSANRLVKVASKRVVSTTELPDEFYRFLSVELHGRVTGYVYKVFEDRGSLVKQGELIVQLSAPELDVRIKQAQAQLTSAESDATQAELQLAAERIGYEKLQEAVRTRCAIAENDLIQAKRQTDAEQALVQSRQRTVELLKAYAKSQQDLAAYLRLSAPFDGVITTRYIHQERW